MEQKNLSLKITPQKTEELSVDTINARKRTQDFIDQYIKDGYLVTSDETKKIYEPILKNIPEENHDDILNAGLQLHVEGVLPEGVFNAIDQAQLSEQEEIILIGIRDVNNVLYAANSGLAEDFARANNHPEFELQRTDISVPIENNILIQSGRDIAFSKAKTKGTDFVKGVFKDVGKDVGKKASEKFLNEAGKEGFKKLAKVATKTGRKVLGQGVDAAVMAALGIPTGGLGAAAYKLLKFLAGKALKLIKKAINSILDKLGLKNKKKELAAVGLGLMGLGLAGGGPALMLGGGFILGVTIVRNFAMFMAFITAATAGYVMWILTAVLSTILLFSVIIFIITTSAYVVPFSEHSLTTGSSTIVGGIEDSPYIRAQKTVSPENDYENFEVLASVGITVTYTISIEPVSGTLTNIIIEDECRIFRRNNNPPCPATNPDALPDPPNAINVGEPYTFSYSMTIQGDDYTDSFILNTITITADTDEQAGAREVTSAAVIIGDAPIGCITFTDTFPQTYRNALIEAAAYLMGNYPAFMAKVCAEGTTPSNPNLVQCYNPDDSGCPNCWGQHLHHPTCDLEWFNGSQWSDALDKSAFIAAHEWMHHVSRINGTLQSRYENYCSPNFPPGSNCTIHETPPGNEICSYPFGYHEVENIAEAVGAYVFLPRTWESRCGVGTTLQSLYPVHYEFVDQFVMH